MSYGRGNEQAMAAALFESVESDVSSRTIRMTNFPAGWQTLSEGQLVSKIKALLQTMGHLEQLPSTMRSANGQLMATATFSDRESAEKAVKTLHGVDNRTETEKKRMDRAPPRDIDKFAVFLLGSSELQEIHGEDDGPPLLLCVDDIRLLEDEVSSAREVFVRDLPVEDYSEAQLREWLQGFGHPEAVLFFKDPGGTELTGKGYVRFSLHEEAVGLLAAFAEDDEEGGVQGNWSLSERLQSAKLADALQTQAEPIAHDCGFTRLVLLGGGRTPPQAAWASLVQKQGPLTFALFAEGDVEKLKVGLTSLIEEALANPSSFSGQSTASNSPPTSPCIMVKGFPRSWREQQVRLVFALFGGVGAVRFVVDPKTGQRMAYVELKNRENMAKAVEQLHNTKVGDGELIEECVVSCELFGDALGSSRALRRTIFLDELKMPKKPDVKPDKEDREVFMTGLPIKDFNEDEIRRWLEGFGQIEEVFLLRDVDRRLNAKGYVRFSSHRHAATCIQAQASEQDAEEGDVIAWWSQSERALRGAYGPNLHSTLASNDGRVFAHLLERCEVREVWMQSKLWPPKDPAAPPMQGKQVHFVATCTAKQLQELHVALSAAVQGFHERVRGDKLGEEGGSSSSFRPPQEPRPAWSTPTTGWSLAPPGPRPAAWPYYRDPYAPHRPPMPGVPPGAPMPWPWRPPGYGPPAMPPRPPGPERKHSRSRRRRREREAAAAAAAPPPSTSAPYIGSVLAMAAEVTSDSKLQDLIVKGEELVQRGQDLKDRGDRDGAYEKFYQGLQFLLKVMPGLGDTNAPPVLNLKSKIHGYLDETEKLKKSLDSKEGNQEAPPMALEDGDLSVEARIEQGETLMQNGQRLAKSGKLGEAYDKYCEGLKLLLQVMPQLREEDAQASRLRSKVSGYLEEAERLKERRDSGGSCAPEENGQGSRRRRRSGRGGADVPPPPRSRAESQGSERRSRRHFHLRAAAEVDREGLRSVGRNGRSPRASAGGSPPPPPGDWRGRSKESPALRKEPPPPPRSRRRCSRSRSRDEDRRPRDDMCRPKSAGMPLLRPKSAAKPGARY